MSTDRPSQLLRIGVIAGCILLLSGCAAGTPGVVREIEPTSSSQQVAAVQATSDVSSVFQTPTSTVEPTPTDTATETPKATRTPKPKPTRTPTPEIVERPEPPENDGSGYSQVYDRGTSGRAEIALTFDAGADRGYAESILDTLESYGVIASFGITGHWAEENPDLVKRMADEGHMIFNHTWTHRSFTGFSTADWDEGVLSTDERIAEIDDTAEIISEQTDGYVVAPYFRPPYGDLDDSVLSDLAANGYWITVMWSCDSLGWNGATVDQIVERCGYPAEAGDIILMHVGAESLDAEALPTLIEVLQANDFELVTIEELLQP